MMNISKRKFGRWTAIECSGRRAGIQPLWKCVCDCGTERLVRLYALTQGKSLSCGCLRKERLRAGALRMNELKKLPPGETAFRATYSQYKRRAAERGMVFSLSAQEFKILAQSNCEYCGEVPLQKNFAGCSNTPFIHNGVDRVDNDVGYVHNNCVPCCKTCNAMKMALTKEQFFSHLLRIAAKQKLVLVVGFEPTGRKV